LDKTVAGRELLSFGFDFDSAIWYQRSMVCICHNALRSLSVRSFRNDGDLGLALPLVAAVHNWAAGQSATPPGGASLTFKPHIRPMLLGLSHFGRVKAPITVHAR
jgi:hypothetical protein